MIQLLDDSSPVVRENVIRQLGAFGVALPEELGRQRIPLSEEQLSELRPMLEVQNRMWLRREWETWFHLHGDKERLEAASALLAEFLHWRLHPVKLGPLLDELVIEFEGAGLKRAPIELAKFLFSLKGLRGVGPDDYYNPMNSSLVHVVEQKRGIPISLASIYILAGYRLGMEIEGCNFPGHFLAIAFLRKQMGVVDCYNGGKVLSQEDLTAIDPSLRMTDLFRLECRGADIIARMLRNLDNAFIHAGKAADASLMKELLESMEVN